MSGSETRYPFPGDNPVQVAVLADRLTAAGESVSRVAAALSLGRTMLSLAWNGAGSELADADVGILAGGLPTLRAGLSSAQSAVVDHQHAMSTARRDVDDIRTRYDHELARFDQARASLDRLIGSTDPADVITADAQKATMRAATVSVELIDADYRAVVQRSDFSAQACSTALAACWNSSGQPTGRTGLSSGMMLLTQGGMGGSSLAVLHTNQMQQLAKDAALALDGLHNPSQDPVERNGAIQSILDSYSPYATDPAFASALANTLGQGYFRDLQSELGNYQHFWGAQDGNDNYQLDTALFTLSASVLSTATDTSNSTHVSDKWIFDLTHDDWGDVQPGWVATATDYLRVGVPFAKSYLDPVGQSAIDWERSRPEGTGDPWQGYGFERFNGSQPLSDPPIGKLDPLGAILDQYTDRPDATSALFGSGALDPTTGRASDPPSGNLMWLLHRRWDDGGADQLGNLLDVMSTPGPNGDPTAAGTVAYNVLTAVALGDDGLGRALPQGMPSELPNDARDSVANITARYMGSIIGESGGQPDTNGLYASGLPNEKESVARVDFGLPKTVTMYGDPVLNDTVPLTLSWLYEDTNNNAVRQTLYSGWLTSSGIGAAQDLQQAQAADQTGNAALYGREVLELRQHTAASARVFGLMTDTDVKSFGESDAAAAAKVEEARSGVRTALVVGKEIIGLTGVPGRVLSAGVGIFNNMLVDDVVPTSVGVAADHHNAANQAAAGALMHLSSSVVTSLSHLDLPVLTVVDPSTGVSLGQTSVVDPASSPDYRLFTDADGHLLPYDEIYQSGKGSDARVEAFEKWYGGTSLFGDISGPNDYEGEVLNAYNAGLAQAQH